MKIESIQRGGGLLVSLHPDDCFRLADACRDASIYNDDERNDRALAALFDVFAATFEGYAIVAAANTYMRPDAVARFTVEGLRRHWLTNETDETIGGDA